MASGAWVYVEIQQGCSRQSELMPEILLSQLGSLEQLVEMGSVMLRKDALLQEKHGAYQTQQTPVPSQFHCRGRYAQVFD